jgi:hypothetical protein
MDRDEAICAALDELSKQGILFKEGGEVFYTGRLKEINLPGMAQHFVEFLADWLEGKLFARESDEPDYLEDWLIQAIDIAPADIGEPDKKLWGVIWKWMEANKKSPVRSAVIDVMEHQR